MSSSIIIGKIVALINQIIARNKGTAFPGYLVLQFNHTLINQIITNNKLQSIIITGTNGKTTTAKLLGDILKLHHLPFIQNSSGSNLLRGIASTLINQSNWFGQLKCNLGIWEVDEATLPNAIKQLQPSFVLITNLSRDQMDRYGEIDTLLNKWQQSFKYLPETSKVYINQTDKHLITLRDKHLVLFGQKNSDADYFQNSVIAAKTLAQALKLKSALIEQTVNHFQPAFGRGETVSYLKTKMTIYLVKNPAGFNAVWAMLRHKNQLNKPLLIILNDLIADGTDVSWIWDIPFNYLTQRQTPIIVSGLRVYDLALRLKYAGLNPKLIIIEPNLTKALRLKPANILPTYTAMLQLRKIIFNQKFA